MTDASTGQKSPTSGKPSKPVSGNVCKLVDVARLAFMRRFDGDKRKARQSGQAGGRAKAVVAAAKRAERVPDTTINRLLWVVENKQVVTWRLLEWILGGKPFSTGTIRRHYEASGPPPPEKRRKADEE